MIRCIHSRCCAIIYLVVIPMISTFKGALVYIQYCSTCIYVHVLLRVFVQLYDLFAIHVISAFEDALALIWSQFSLWHYSTKGVKKVMRVCYKKFIKVSNYMISSLINNITIWLLNKIIYSHHNSFTDS